MTEVKRENEGRKMIVFFLEFSVRLMKRRGEEVKKGEELDEENDVEEKRRTRNKIKETSGRERGEVMSRRGEDGSGKKIERELK